MALFHNASKGTLELGEPIADALKARRLSSHAILSSGNRMRFAKLRSGTDRPDLVGTPLERRMLT